MNKQEDGPSLLITPRFLLLSFFVLGVSSVISQVVFIRELAASFYGNEFFTGWVLFSWLLWTGLGSAYGSSRPQQSISLPNALMFSSFLVAALAFFEVIFIRSNRLVLGQPAGVLPDLIPSLIYSFLAIGPLCFLLGVQFSIAARTFLSAGTGSGPGRVMGRAYLLETAGFIAGGVAFSLFLVRVNAFIAMSVVAWCNFIVACLIVRTGRKKPAQAAAVIFSLFMILFLSASGRLEKITAQFRFPSEDLVATKNTLRGNIAVTHLKGQHNFYQNGILLGADREELASEYLVHFPMLVHPNPRKVLLLGTGLNGPLKEILKHGPEEVVAIDLDPEFNDFAARYLPDDLKKVFSDSRVRFWHGDSRAYFRGSQERFDVIISNFPDPLSILVDRNYTKEFFNRAQDHLAQGGIFATHLGFAANYVTPELERLGSSVYATLQDVFDHVKVLPEDTVYFLASSTGADFADIGKIAARISGRGLSLDFVTSDYLKYRFTNDRVAQVTTVFDNSIWKVKNMDLKPQAYYFAFTRWLSQFHPRVSQVLLRLTEIPFAAVMVGLLLFLAGPVLLRGSAEGNVRRLSRTAMRTAGFTVMAFEIVLIYLFQVFFGDLYYRIAGLIAALMAGIGIGTWAATLVKFRSSRITLAGIHFLSVLFYTALVITMHGIRNALILPGVQEVLFYGFAVLSGALAGLEFPFASDLYLVAGKGKHAGAVYAADLFGSCLGALVTAGFLIPVWGVKKTLILLIAMNAMLALFLLFRKDLSGKDV